MDFPWLGEQAALRYANITVSWQTPPGGQDRLRIEIDDANEQLPASKHIVHDGTSPIFVSIGTNGTSDLGPALQIVLGTSSEGLTPLGTIALVSQQVDLTVEQTFSC